MNNKLLIEIEDYINENLLYGPYELIKTNNIKVILSIYGIYNSQFSGKIIKRKQINIGDIVSIYKKRIKGIPIEANDKDILFLLKIIDIINHINTNNNYDIKNIYSILSDGERLPDYEIDDSNILELQRYLFYRFEGIKYKLEIIQIILYIISIDKNFSLFSINYAEFLSKQYVEMIYLERGIEIGISDIYYIYYIYLLDFELTRLKKDILKNKNINLLKLLGINHNITTHNLYLQYTKKNSISEETFYRLLSKEVDILGDNIIIRKEGVHTVYSFNYYKYIECYTLLNYIYDLLDLIPQNIKTKQTEKYA